MSTKQNIAIFLRRYKQEHALSVAEMARKLCISKSSLEVYLSGDGNPSADTIDLLAEKLGVSPAEMISAQPPRPKWAALLAQAAEWFSDLPPERRSLAAALSLALIDTLFDGTHS